MRRLLQLLQRFFPLSRRKARRQSRAFFEKLEPLLLFSGAPLNIVLIDSALADTASLRNAVTPGAIIITYDRSKLSAQAVLHQAVQLAIAKDAPIASLTLLSHGTAGEFSLGSDLISTQTLTVTTPAWQNLSQHLAPDARFYLYDCRVVQQGSSGQSLIDNLATLTGASIYASTNLTGKGGDWTLEASSQNALPLNPTLIPLDTAKLANYQGDLPWTGATSGSTNNASHTYNNTANWQGGVIDDSFAGVTLTGSLTLYMSAARNASGGMNLGYSGNFDLTIESDSTTARTLTLGNDITGNFGGANGRTVTIGDPNNPVNVSIPGTRTFTATSAGDVLEFVNVISGSGGITTAGSGTVLLNGANTYTGATTIATGTTLQVGDGTNATAQPGDATVPGSASAIADSGTFLVDINADAQWQDAFSGAGAWQLLYSGSPYSLKLDGDTSGYSGTVTINSGTRLQIDASPALFASNAKFIVNSGGALFENVPGTFGASMTLAGTGYSNDVHGFGALRVGNLATTFTGNITLAANALIAGGTTVNTNITLAGNITDGGNGFALALASTGTVILSGASTYTGGTTIDGDVRLGSSTGLPTNGNVALGATVAEGNLAANTAGILIMNGFNATIGSLTQAIAGSDVENDGSSNSTLTLGAGNPSFTYAGTFIDGSGSGLLNVTKNGSGTMTLTAANTFTGTTTISAGAIAINVTAALGNSTVSVGTNNGMVFASGIGTVTIGGLSGGSNQLLRDAGAAAVALQVGNNNTDTTYTGILSSSGSITKIGTGNFTLSGADTYTGTTTLSSGGLNTNNATAIGTGTFIVNGGSIDNTSGSPITLTSNNAQTWGGDFSYGGTNDLNLGTGAVTFSATRTITVNGAANLTVAGNLSGTTNALLVTGPGTLILSGTNSFSGGLQVNSGTQSSTRVVAASSGALGSGTVQIAPGGNATTATLVLTGGITISNAISVFGRNTSTAPAVESLVGSNTISSTLSLQTGGTFFPLQVDSGSTLTLSAANSINAGSLTGSRVVPLMGAGTGNINGTITEGTSTTGLIANQTGTWNLKGAGTFSGGVTLNSGTTSFISGALGSGTITFGGNSTLQWATGNTLDVSASLAAIPTAVTATIDTNANNVTFASAISGNGALQKVGAGALTLPAADTLSGGVTLSAGQLNINNAAALGAGTFTINGGTIDNTSGGAITLSTNNAQTWNGSFTFVGTKNLNLGSGTATLGASVTATVSGVLTVGGTITDGASTFALTKAGTGTLILAGPAATTTV